MAVSIPVGDNAVVVQLQLSTHYNIRCYDTKLRVLAGECYLNGCNISPNTVPMTLSSLDSHSRMSLNAGNSSDISASVVSKCLEEAGVSEGEILSNVGAVLLIELSDISSVFLRSTYKRLWESSTQEEPIIKLDYFELYAGLTRSVSISSDWSDPVSSLKSAPLCRVAVCGPQNSGKSTLCRYTVNTLLAQHNTVLLLESDIGQCELTPSGLVTLSLIKEPLVNPPYCNKVNFVSSLSLSQPHFTSQSYCVGVASPSQVMGEYLGKLKLLIDKAIELNDNDVPLVANFMGWTKGFGVALHADILRMLEPTHVLNLQTNSPKDLPPITTVLATPGILPDPETNMKSPPEIFNIPGHISSNSTSGFQAFELRHLALLNYFSPIYKTPSAVCAPYKVSWKHVLVIIPEGIEENLAAYTLNCSVVALLTGPPTATTDNDINLIEEDDSIMRCLGMGIIRAVDVSEKVFYLNTPVDKATLEQVFVFKHTSLSVPHMPSGSLPVPYVSNLAASEILGMGSRSQRANLKRRYHAIAQN